MTLVDFIACASLIALTVMVSSIVGFAMAKSIYGEILNNKDSIANKDDSNIFS